MLRELRLPDLGEGVTEGEVVAWLVGEGDAVAEDTPLVEVLTDKVSVQIPSPYSGTVARLHVAPGTTVPVGTLLISVEVGAPAAASSAPATLSSAPATLSSASDTASPPAPTPRSRILALPSTRRLARERGVDLATVEPTGVRGRVSDADVIRAAGERRSGPTGTPATPPPDAAPGARGDRRVPVGGVRRRIAEHLVRAAAVPTVTLVEEAEFDRVDVLRDAIVERDGVRLSYLPFVVLATCAAIRRMPILNSRLDDATGDIVIRGEINIGIATDTEQGLLVPVVHAADAMSLLDVHRALTALAASARAGTLRPEQLRGSTFTISSPGRWGGVMATPLLNHPETALLGVHRAEPRPVVRAGAIVIRTVGNLSLTFDHRVVDGVTAARFTRLVVEAIEEPGLLSVGTREET